MISKNNTSPLLGYIRLCALFQSHHQFKLELQSWNAQFRSKLAIFFIPSVLVIWRMTLKNNRAPLLCYFKLCAWFHSHRSIQTGVMARKCQLRVKIGDFFVPCDLEIWRMTLKNDRAHFLCHIKLCASFYHMWIQSGVTVRKGRNWVLTSVTLTFDPWPWPFSWTSLLSMVITLNISWWCYDGIIVKKVWQTDRPMVRRTDGLNHS